MVDRTNIHALTKVILRDDDTNFVFDVASSLHDIVPGLDVGEALGLAWTAHGKGAATLFEGPHDAALVIAEALRDKGLEIQLR